MEKNKYIPKVRVIDVNTYKRYMSLFYRASPQYKRGHSAIKELWESINCDGKKKAIIAELVDYNYNKSKGVKLDKIDMTCLEYLNSKT